MCGLASVLGAKDPVYSIVEILRSNVHRGEESTGIVGVSSDFNNAPNKFAERGSAVEVLTKDAVERLNKFPSDAMIAHGRYGTQGTRKATRNIQPFEFQTKFGEVILAHNGTMPIAIDLRNEIIRSTALQSDSDSEVIAQLISRSTKEALLEAIIETLQVIKVAFSLILISREHDGKLRMYAARDLHSVHPIWYGKVDEGYFISSEDAGLSFTGENHSEVNQGEIVIFEHLNPEIQKISFGRPEDKEYRCAMESIYFSGVASSQEKVTHSAQCNRSSKRCTLPWTRRSQKTSKVTPFITRRGSSKSQCVKTRSYNRDFRLSTGRQLAIENQDIKGDLIIPVPQSGIPAGIGLHQESGIPMDLLGLTRKVSMRSFTAESSKKRKHIVRAKFHLLNYVVHGKHIILVDDSIVRGTTMRELIKWFRKAGVKSISVYITSPPIKRACMYGMDYPEETQLIAHGKTISQIRDSLGMDDLRYLSMKGLGKVIHETHACDYCDGCFGGNYPPNKMVQLV